MADRDDAALRNFSSRARQPKFIAELPKQKTPNACGYSHAATHAARANARAYTPDATTINVNLSFDSGFGGHMHESDTMQFRSMGTSPAYSAFNNSMARRNGANCMRSGFSS